VEKEWFKVRELARDLYNMFRPGVMERSLNFNIFIHKEMPLKVFHDKLRIKQILVNLLSNAIKYTERGSIMLSIDWKENHPLNPAGTHTHFNLRSLREQTKSKLQRKDSI